MLKHPHSQVLAASLGVLLLAFAGCGGAAGAAPAVSHRPAARAAALAAPSRAAGPAPAVSTRPAARAAALAPPSRAAGAAPAVSTRPAARAAALAPPLIHSWPIPYGKARRREMAAYSLRHYGEDTYALSNPKVIVEHYTETANGQEAFNTFAPDVPDAEFHELPNTCAHFLVEPSGRIDQLVPLTLRCRHTTGLNWTAIGIENVGFSDQQVLGDRAQLRASLRLTRGLRCRYGIALKNVIGHNESLSSPFHRDLVPAFQHQTHSDFNRADMHRYRTLLARMPCPAA